MPHAYSVFASLSSQPSPPGRRGKVLEVCVTNFSAFLMIACYHKAVSALTPRARKLRQTMTDAERVLWQRLCSHHLGHKFRRQVPRGTYIVDFVCLEKKLVVEVDGAHHLNNVYDKNRDAWLSEQGYHVLRFWNHEVLKNTEGVLEKIRLELDALPH
jgi:very-short-patch-repair endonuclease